MIEPFLLTATRISTFMGSRPLTNASGFFFARDGRLFLVTSRHVVYDEPSQHFPDRLEIELHIGLENVARSMGFSMPLYRDGKGLWRVGIDAGGDIDVAVIEVDREALPSGAAFRAFTPQHLAHEFDEAEAGTPLLVIGFPLGFHDTLHHMPVVRHAIVASSFGLRFQGQGYFLTDSRTHRGSSGSPIVARMRVPSATHGDLPWTLVGVHSARIDIDTRDLQLDEALGLNVAWYADILLKLTEAAD
jgi:S1-C subfamily serine protease